MIADGVTGSTEESHHRTRLPFHGAKPSRQHRSGASSRPVQRTTCLTGSSGRQPRGQEGLTTCVVPSPSRGSKHADGRHALRSVAVVGSSRHHRLRESLGRGPRDLRTPLDPGDQRRHSHTRTHSLTRSPSPAASTAAFPSPFSQPQTAQHRPRRGRRSPFSSVMMHLMHRGRKHGLHGHA